MAPERKVDQHVRGCILLLVFGFALLAIFAPLGWHYEGSKNGIPMNDCYSKLAVGDLLSQCHPLFGWYALVISGALFISLIASMFNMIREPMWGRAAVLVENLMMFLSVNMLAVGFFLAQLILYGMVSVLTISGYALIVVFIFQLLYVAP